MNVEDLINLPKLRDGLTLVAGEEGLGRNIRWIYFADCFQCVQEQKDPADYIHGEEIVIITNVTLTDHDDMVLGMIRSMNRKNIAAVVINAGQISQAVSKYCEQIHLPLFELAEDLHLIDLSQIVCQELMKEESTISSRERLFSEILNMESTDREEIMAQASYLGVDLSGQFFVVHFHIYDKNPQPQAAAGQRYDKKSQPQAAAEQTYDKKSQPQAAVRQTYDNKPHLQAESGQTDDTDNESPGSRISLADEVAALKASVKTEFRPYVRGHMLVMDQMDNVLALVPWRVMTREDLEAVIDRVCRTLSGRGGSRVRAGVGLPYQYPEEMRISWKEARDALKINHRIFQSDKNVLFYESLGIYSVVTQIQNERFMDEYIDAHLGKLIEADQVQEGDLMHTLEVYLSSGANANDAAEKLYLHRNTMHYRLNKIRKILNIDLSNLDTELELELAFAFYRYRNQREITLK